MQTNTVELRWIKIVCYRLTARGNSQKVSQGLYNIQQLEETRFETVEIL